TTEFQPLVRMQITLTTIKKVCWAWRSTLRKSVVPSFITSALLASCLTALGGSFTSDFSNANQTGTTLRGSGSLPDGSRWRPIISGNTLMLTTNTAPGGQMGTIVLNDLD